ncbi:DUF402 domain-containing protein [Jatrophihabitans telluris]|uniref:DUF402 domain-containing protein n=1 Tax=Jatrophihabitans telluris TaxID=2038343 RepID=A0ABY4R271_9ACTN|nr:DUF402 domain-containing protein [Jatrophihabitans telluris]UQX89642.1 DUF402 domain-containing protein [Jatrophihabitans telluris]
MTDAHEQAATEPERGKREQDERERDGAAQPSEVVNLEFTKFGGTRHWHFRTTRLGHDEHGLWLGARAGTPVQRGDEPPITWDCDFVVLVPRQGDWVATFNAAGKYEVYVDITGPITQERGLVLADDLDLDVVRYFDGRVALLDEDEFAQHQTELSYPAAVIAAAERSAATVLDLVRADTAPFDGTGRRWLEQIAPELAPELAAELAAELATD